MVNGTLGTLDDDEIGRGAPTKQHRSSADGPGPGQQDALADDESPRLAEIAQYHHCKLLVSSTTAQSK